MPVGGKLSHCSDSEGFEIDRDHFYQTGALYENPLEYDIDAMAMLYVYDSRSEDVEDADRKYKRGFGVMTG